MSRYVQYGCGFSAPEGWDNFDVSPTLWLQRLPLVGGFFRSRSSVKFPLNVLVGDIVKGLPGVPAGSCKGVYCSHVLEHLSLADCRTALKHSFDMLAPDGVFRMVLPDLEVAVNDYLKQMKLRPDQASIHFMQDTLLGMDSRPRTNMGRIRLVWGNSRHLWMWDHDTMEAELRKVGFTRIRRCTFGDAEDPMFQRVEDESRFARCVAFEVRK